MALAEDQNVTLNFDYRGLISTCRVDTPKVGPFRLKIMPNQLLNNSKTTFKTQKWLFRPQKWSR